MFDDDYEELGQAAMFDYMDRHHNSTSQGFLKVLGEIPLQITVELGRTNLPVSEILKLQVGSVVELDKLAVDPVDIRVNSKLVGRGEVVSVDECYGVRVTGLINR
ncbi:MAG TPA: flagellar motor switch protein FliN [Candidatus Eremiobacteraeota bacterium]|nr:MAG: Flagellar motor switch protein FliN [bacterium ADurb.Bin363]HPZ07029.1 flagellar motor switch protein FliN [Candidatus Eremiobacteraeota bacterium]